MNPHTSTNRPAWLDLTALFMAEADLWDAYVALPRNSPLEPLVLDAYLATREARDREVRARVALDLIPNWL